MAESSNLPRRYSEKEVARILRRATELGRDEAGRESGGDGTSLVELEDIAREAGIDPGLVRRAAVELDVGGASVRGWHRLLGERTTLIDEVTVDGEVPADAFERLVGVIQDQVHEHGHPTVLGRTLTWRSETQNRSRTLQVTVAARDGRTVVRVEERLGQLAGGVFGGGMGGFGGGLGFGLGLPLGIEVLGSAAVAVAFPLGILGLSYVGARAVYRHLVRGRRKALAALVHDLAAECRSAMEAADVRPDHLPELPRA